MTDLSTLLSKDGTKMRNLERENKKLNNSIVYLKKKSGNNSTHAPKG